MDRDGALLGTLRELLEQLLPPNEPHEDAPRADEPREEEDAPSPADEPQPADDPQPADELREAEDASDAASDTDTGAHCRSAGRQRGHLHHLGKVGERVPDQSTRNHTRKYLNYA